MRLVLSILLSILLIGCATSEETREWTEIIKAFNSGLTADKSATEVKRPLEFECRERGSRVFCTQPNSNVELECRKRGNRVICAE